jgi:hypothetical protein
MNIKFYFHGHTNHISSAHWPCVAGVTRVDSAVGDAGGWMAQTHSVSSTPDSSATQVWLAQSPGEKVCYLSPHALLAHLLAEGTEVTFPKLR